MSDHVQGVYRHVQAARDALSVRRVFGEAYEAGGATIIPVARVIGGAGTGSARGEVRPTEAGEDADGTTGTAHDRAPGEPAATGEGTGAGRRPGVSGSMGSFAACARPAGVFVVRDGDVTWKPAWSLNAAILGGQVFGGVVALATAGVLRARAKRARRVLRRAR